MTIGNNVVARHRRGLTPSAGFTLIELVVTIAVAAILMGLAFPSFTELNRRMTVSTNTNDLIGALNLARSEAVKRGVQVAVVSVSGSSTWNTGWSVKPDIDNNGVFDSADTAIRIYPPLTTNYSVTTAATGPGVAGQLAFDGTGALVGATAFDINICRPDSNPAQSRHIVVRGSGEVTSYRNTAGSPAPGC